jgi:cytoskeleton protein RodZ
MTDSLDMPAAGQGGNPGQTLRAARERQGLSLTDVAARLNLTVSALGYLEAGEFARLPGHTFARGYIRAYARLVDLDAAALVQDFDRLTGSDASGAEVRNLNRIAEPTWLSKTLLKLVSALLLLLLAGLGYYLWQETPAQFARLGNLGLRHIEVDKANGTTELHRIDDAQQARPVALPIEAPAGSEAAAGPAPLGVTPAAGISGQALALPPGHVSVSQLNALATPAAPVSLEVPESQRVAAAPQSPAIEVPAGHGLLQASFSGDCWLQVTDARGKVVFSGVKRKGETLDVTGVPPLQVHLGNAAAATLSYNGKPVERGNVGAAGTARLKLGE